MEKLKRFLNHTYKSEIQIYARNDFITHEASFTLPLSWQSIINSGASFQSALSSIWQPVVRHKDSLLDYIVQHTLDIHVVLFSSSSAPLGLLYSIAGEGVNYWLGGLPIEKREIISVEQKLAINLPSSLKLFSNIHNGFLLDGASAFGVRPLNSLFCLDDYDIFSDLDIDYDPKKCLAFCGDGAGNEQCFSINHPIHENDYMTYDWDHETRELTKPQSFWDFLERFIKNSVW